VSRIMPENLSLQEGRGFARGGRDIAKRCAVAQDVIAKRSLAVFSSFLNRDGAQVLFSAK
jgi:hypothetical protein